MRINSDNLRLIVAVFFLTLFTVFQNAYAQYCTPVNIGNYNNYYISNVSFGSIDNSSTGPTGGYTYYSSLSAADILVGETITGTVRVTLDGWNKNKHTLIVWMNFNNSDDDFEDSGEQLTFKFQDKTQPSGLKTIEVPISIPVPNTAQLGSSVMRIGVRDKQSANYSSCDYNYKAGEVEDYNINYVSDSKDNSGTPIVKDPEYTQPKNIGNWNNYYISNVSLGAIDNDTSGETGGFNFYSSIEGAKIEAGETLEGIIEVTLDSWNTETNMVVVWVNLNEENDDDFEDRDERFLFSFNSSSYRGGNDRNDKKKKKTIDVPISVPIPEDVVAGNSVIRIGVIEGTDTNFSSTDFNYKAGEVEDYKLVFKTSKSSQKDNSIIDTDGDGVGNDDDIDDDNDGVLDEDEYINLLTQSGFNNVSGLNYGNNIGVSISPWILGNGNQANIVKVDGNGGYNYMNGGPFEDANPNTGDGEDQYYLDIASGSNDFYQTFTVNSNSILIYGGYFSSRDGKTGSGRLRIFSGSSGSSGTLIADSGTFAVSPVNGNSSTTPWVFIDDEANVTPGTYSFVVSMDNHTNFDEGFARDCYDTDKDGIPDYLDLDSDNDGIPDNVEAQTTLGYIVPSYTYDGNGVDSNYPGGIVLVDTDADGVPDLRDSDSDNDGTPDIEENGMANTFTAADVDGDGLNNAFETNGVDDAIWDVNEDIEAPTDLSILPDGDGDLASGGDLDYRDLFDINPPSSATIDFDGVDDYLESDLNMTGYTQATVMAWIKLDENFATQGYILNYGNLYIRAQNSKKIRFQVNDTYINSSFNLTENIWAHVALIFDSSSVSTKLKVYVNGELQGTSNDASLANAVYSSSDKFTIGARALDYSKLFKGSIDEVRVFNKALTEDQLQKIVYQEIQESSGNVKGNVVSKPVVDCNDQSVVPWSNLKVYYPMTDILSNTTTDLSGNGLPARLFNITDIQAQTAPMPYKTIADGPWTSKSTWLNGNVWDITELDTNNDFSIIEINNDVSASHDIKSLALLINSNKTLTINADSQVWNNWYLELNGTLDLMGDSQLIQTQNSDLVTSASGKILRRQEGASSPFWYNYWGSPVGELGATTLSDNNGSSNNVNNSPFKLNMLKDESGFNMSFISGYTGNGSISKTWLYTFKNGVTYWDWKSVAPTTPIEAGVGYTQKGAGNGGSTQQYIFEGKPNNGTILLSATDKGGSGSEHSKSKTQYLLGNPYPSALDLHQFIDDNQGVIDGTISLWQQWAGSSHYLNEYQGGYAQVNKTGACRAYQFVGIYGDHNGSQDGVVVPTRYIPVGQGFMAEIIADGLVEFNNGQRVFIKEASADGSYENGSTFSKSANNGKSSEKKVETGAMKKFRLELNSVSGPETTRELLLGFSNYTSDEFDYGYEAKCTETNNNDLNLALNNQGMTIQAYGEITADKVIPLNFKSSGNNSFEIKVTEKENLEVNQPIYLRDNQTGEYFNLTEGEAYQFSSEAGVFNNRFEIVFQGEQQSLSTAEVLASENYMYFQNSTNTFFAKKLNSEVKNLALINIRGQRILELSNVSTSQLTNGIPFTNLSTGAYVVCLRTATNEVLTKKIIIN